MPENWMERKRERRQTGRQEGGGGKLKERKGKETKNNLLIAYRVFF